MQAPQALGIHRDGGFADHVLVPDARYLLDYGNLAPSQACTYACSGLTAYSALKKAGRIGAKDPLVISALAAWACRAFAWPSRCLALPRSLWNWIKASGRSLAQRVPAMVSMKAVSVIGSYVGSLAEMQELMAIAKTGVLPDMPVSEQPLANATAALEDLRAGRVRGRIILQCDEGDGGMTAQPADWSRLSQLRPVALWRDWLVKSEAQWIENLSSLLKDPQAGGVFKRQVDEMRMAQRQFSEVPQASLAAANLPSRTDFEALDERLGRLEDGLAQVAAQMSLLSEALVAQGAVAPAAKPSRDRRPATSKAAPAVVPELASEAEPKKAAKKAPKAAISKLARSKASVRKKA